MANSTKDSRKRARKRRFDLSMLAGVAIAAAMVALRWHQHSALMAQVRAQQSTPRAELAGEFVAVVIVAGLVLFILASVVAARARSRSARAEAERVEARPVRRRRMAGVR
jgi:hypothetical protein